MQVKEWLIDTRADVLDHGRCLLHGEEVTFGQINNSRLRSAVLEHYRQGQDALKGFVRWLKRHEGLSEKAARVNAAFTWNALCVSWDQLEQNSHPEVVLESKQYSTSMLYKFHAALLRWARYTKDVELSGKIRDIADSQKPVVHHTDPVQMAKTPPYTPAEIEALLTAIEQLRDDPRWPWGWPVLRMIVVAGLSTSEILDLTADQMRRALESGALVLWRVHRGARSIPVDLVRQEIETFLRWPWSWGSVMDIVSPRCSGGYNRTNMSTKRIKDFAQICFDKAGVEMFPTMWSMSCRWASALRYYELTGNVVGVAHICRIRNIRKVQAEIEVMKKRQKERVAKLGGKGRRRRQSASTGPSPNEAETSDR